MLGVGVYSRGSAKDELPGCYENPDGLTIQPFNDGNPFTIGKVSGQKL